VIPVESGILRSKTKKFGAAPMPSGQRVFGTISSVSQGEVAQLRYMVSLERRFASFWKYEFRSEQAIRKKP